VASGEHHEVGQRGALAEAVGRLLGRVEEERVHVAGVVHGGRAPGVELSRAQELRLHLEVARVERVGAEVGRGLLLNNPGRVPVARVRQPTRRQKPRGQPGQVRNRALRQPPALARRGGRERRVGNAPGPHQRHGRRVRVVPTSVVGGSSPHGMVPRRRRRGTVPFPQVPRVRHQIRQRAVEPRVQIPRRRRNQLLHPVLVHRVPQRVLQAARRLRKSLQCQTLIRPQTSPPPPNMHHHHPPCNNPDSETLPGIGTCCRRALQPSQLRTRAL
jgi:hypothetical protein